MEEALIKIGGMNCQSCVNNITDILAALPGVSSATVSLAPGEALVRFDPSVIARAALTAAIEDAGFDADAE
ncbi:MAG: heavy-metal-associated domain-containing protein [Betaproteobacteria bacterium]|nr:heavy-metal-associated domain-containing protein [Betaproteobacteria bacterium]MCL2886066.1 heavy-metal-associated domain-containing protein [Betaproteobacteria bacterium]